MKLNVKDITLISMFSVLIAVGAFIKIPISLVPITLQTLFVMLAGFILTKKQATLSVLLYILIGLVGFPVFVNGGGITYVLQPSFGYIIGFLFAVVFISKLYRKDMNKINRVIIGLIALLIIYISGMLYFYLIQWLYYGIVFDLSWIFYYLFVVYLPGDILSLLLALVIADRVKVLK